jgi:hypothetical protein
MRVAPANSAAAQIFCRRKFQAWNRSGERPSQTALVIQTSRLAVIPTVSQRR